MVQVQAASVRRLLVVDDHDDARLALAAYLRANGFQVTAVTDGQEALESVLAGGVDLVILDLMMPGVDGFEFLRQLRALPDDRAATPVVVVSGSLPAVVDGATACFEKPAVLHELLAKVRLLTRATLDA